MAAITEFTRRLGDAAEQDALKIRYGGTEEEIIKRGSVRCTDVARVACAMCQVAGFSCGIVYLCDLARAYSGHAVVEAHRAGRWGALDSSTGITYVTAQDLPASVWDLMNNPKLVEEHRKNPRAYYTTPGRFRAAGIAKYSVREGDRYECSVTGIDDYCFSILSISDKEWTGGLRWLRGENEGGGETTGAAGASHHTRWATPAGE